MMHRAGTQCNSHGTWGSVLMCAKKFTIWICIRAKCATVPHKKRNATWGGSHKPKGMVIMALSRAFEERLSSPANFGKLFGLGLLLSVAAFLMQTSPVDIGGRTTPAVRLRLIDASEPSAPQPVYNPEAGMSASELMQRWEPAI